MGQFLPQAKSSIVPHYFNMRFLIHNLWIINHLLPLTLTKFQKSPSNYIIFKWVNNKLIVKFPIILDKNRLNFPQQKTFQYFFIYRPILKKPENILYHISGISNIFLTISIKNNISTNLYRQLIVNTDRSYVLLLLAFNSLSFRLEMRNK